MQTQLLIGTGIAFLFSARIFSESLGTITKVSETDFFPSHSLIETMVSPSIFRYSEYFIVLPTDAPSFCISDATPCLSDLEEFLQPEANKSKATKKNNPPVVL